MRDEPYVTGDTNWERFELPQLIAMVTERVSLRGLMDLAEDWRTMGHELVGSAHELAAALDQLMDFWSGTAAEQARTDVRLNAQWLSDLGTTAYSIGTPIEVAAGALKAAQEQMPQLPAVDPYLAPGSAPDGAAAAELAGGPLGAAIGGMAAGTESAAAAAEQEAALKRQAVETMRRFETAAMDIDQTIPRFEGPSPVLRPRPPEPRSSRPPATTVTVTTNTNNTTVSWQELTGGGSSATFAQNSGDHHGGGAHRGLPVGAGTGAGGGGLDLMRQGAGGGRGAGMSSGTGGIQPGERMPGTLPASAAMIDPDGPATGMGGAPMAGGMGAAAGGNSANDHRRRFPFDADEPFALDQKASPPVIGL